MKKYIWTKVVNAKPMSRLDYTTLRGWALPADENGADKGFLIENAGGHFPGYISWIPKAQFDDACIETAALSFGQAIDAIKRGARVARAGWNGKGMWVALITSWNGNGMAPLPGDWHAKPFIVMKTVDNGVVPWFASQADMLAEDWVFA